MTAIFLEALVLEVLGIFFRDAICCKGTGIATKKKSLSRIPEWYPLALVVLLEAYLLLVFR